MARSPTWGTLPSYRRAPLPRFPGLLAVLYLLTIAKII